MKWEYKVIEINSMEILGDYEKMQEELNNYRDEDWELEETLTESHEGIGWIQDQIMVQWYLEELLGLNR